MFVAFTLLGVYFNASFWTLVVEWKWYFVLPVLLKLYGKFGLLLGVLAPALALSVLSANWLLGRHDKLDWQLGPLLLYLPVFSLGIFGAAIVAGRVPDTATELLVRHAGWGFLLSLAVAWIVPTETEDSMGLARALPFGLLFFFLLLLATRADGRRPFSPRACS